MGDIMISLHIALLLIWIHFVADFIFQSNYTAINKSKDNYVLLYHVILYGILFIPFSIQYAFLNAALHFGVDYITSRAVSYTHLDVYKRQHIYSGRILTR